HADDEARRKQLRSAGSPFQYSNVTSKWRRVCENQYSLDEVAERVVTLQQVKMEATHVANLHCLRHFEHKYRPRSWHDREAKLVLNNTFFYRCCKLPNEDNTKGIPGNPTETNIKKYPVHFLWKMYDMLILLEETVASNDRTPRGCKLFSILPVTTSFVPSYITINTTVLYDMGKRIMKQKGIDVFNLFKRTDTKGAKVYATTSEFQAMRHRI
ncbi:hypothetical protein BBJ28_00027135, partial [Nothophytophthora sp. Chile5]